MPLLRLQQPDITTGMRWPLEYARGHSSPVDVRGVRRSLFAVHRKLPIITTRGLVTLPPLAVDTPRRGGGGGSGTEWFRGG